MASGSGSANSEEERRDTSISLQETLFNLLRPGNEQEFMNLFMQGGSNPADVMGLKIAKDYMEYPEIPVGRSLTIHAIGAVNYKPMTKEALGHLQYKHFRQRYPDTYPIARNPREDYTDDDQVSSATVTYSTQDQLEQKIKGRVKMLL